MPLNVAWTSALLLLLSFCFSLFFVVWNSDQELRFSWDFADAYFSDAFAWPADPEHDQMDFGQAVLAEKIKIAVADSTVGFFCGLNREFPALRRSSKYFLPRQIGHFAICYPGKSAFLFTGSVNYAFPPRYMPFGLPFDQLNRLRDRQIVTIQPVDRHNVAGFEFDHQVLHSIRPTPTAPFRTWRLKYRLAAAST